MVAAIDLNRPGGSVNRPASAAVLLIAADDSRRCVVRSNSALTFWICDACSLTARARRERFSKGLLLPLVLVSPLEA
jgi:hypothetical protein